MALQLMHISVEAARSQQALLNTANTAQTHDILQCLILRLYRLLIQPLHYVVQNSSEFEYMGYVHTCSLLSIASISPSPKHSLLASSRPSCHSSACVTATLTISILTSAASSTRRALRLRSSNSTAAAASCLCRPAAFDATVIG
eukprot:4616-Heterococcus_DN1.PRE.4